MEQSTIQRLISILTFLGLIGFGAASWTGCGVSPIPVEPRDPTGANNGGGTPPVEDLVDSQVGGADPFASAYPLDVLHGSTFSLDDQISTPASVDVYDLGPVLVGERLTVSVEPHDSLDPVLGLFDGNGDSLIVNDDRNYYGGDFSSRVIAQVRHDSPACFIAVASSRGSGTRGGYTLTVTRSGIEPVTSPPGQRVYLNFDGGGPIVIGRRDPVRIPPFEESEIADNFSGQVEALIDATVEHMRLDYQGLEVVFVSSREGPEPLEPHTTIHFGAYDPGLLGIADYVDEFNAALTQKAIVYVDTFAAFLSLGPSLDEMAMALANVASHETGHLLGLNHTSDSRDVMDVTASLRQMLANQAFRRSPLHPDVFPIGHQDNARLLVDAVGGDLAQVKAAAIAQLSLRAKWYDEGDRTPVRLDGPLSSCFCEGCVKRTRQR